MTNRYILYLVFSLYSLSTTGQSNKICSKLGFTTLDGFVMKPNMFQAKNVIISLFDANNPNRAALKSLDSIQKKYYHEIIVIGIPVSDSSQSDPTASLFSIVRDSLQLSFPIMQISKSKNGVILNGVYDIIKDSSSGHFDPDIDKLNQTWMFDSSGKVYSYFRNNQLVDFYLIERLYRNQVALDSVR